MLPARSTYAALAGVVIALSGVASASATVPAHSVALTHGNSPFSYGLNILAGSPSYVVYAKQPAWQPGLFGTQTVVARAQDGTETVLTGTDNVSPFGLADSVLSGQRGNSTVVWWDLAQGTHGTATLPSSASYLGAAPDGWLYGENGHVFDQPTSGSAASDLGAPLGTSDELSDSQIQSGAAGFAVQGDSSIVYRAWSGNSYQPLNFDFTKYQLLGCTSIVANAIGCSATDMNYSSQFVVRIPVDGSAATITTLADRPYDVRVALTDTMTLWTDIPSKRLFSVPVAGGTTTTSTFGTLQEQLVSALGVGAFVTGSLAQQRLAFADDATSISSTLPSPGRSPVHAADVELTTNRIAYADNEKDYNAGDIWSRSLSGTGSVTAGAPSLLLATPSTSYGLSVSGSLTTDDIATTKGSAVVVVWPHHRRSLSGSSSGQASGHRVLYTDSKGNWHLFDIKSGHSTSANIPKGGAALAGNYLAYSKSDGSIWRKKIGTHTSVRLKRALPSNATAYLTKVYAFGDYVGWSQYTAKGILSGFRNARTMAKAISIPSRYQLDRITSNGVVVHHQGTGQTSFRTIAWYVHPYSAASTKWVQVLTQTYTYEEINAVGEITERPVKQVAVGGGRIAWIDTQGTAHVAPLPAAAR